MSILQGASKSTMAVQPGPDDLRLLQDKVFFAAVDNQPQVIRDCLESLHPDVVKDVLHLSSTHKGSTPLIIAAWNGHLEVVELLVNEFNVDVNQKVLSLFERHHALISAVYRGHLDIVKVLVTKGCNISAASRNGQTAVSVACDETHLDIIKYLEKNGAQINEHIHKNGRSCLVNACLNGNQEMMEFLLSKGADPNIIDEGETVLHDAVRRDAPEIIKLLLQHGATFTKNRFGRSPLVEAALTPSKNAVQILLDSVDLTELERIEGLELLGATLSHTNVDKAFMYVRLAMEERHRNPNNVLLKPHSPLPTLSKIQESQTIEEVQARQTDQHLFRLECLAILSRILGPHDFVTIHSFKAYSDVLQSAGHHKEATAVLLHGMKAAAKSSNIPDMHNYILQLLYVKFGEIWYSGMPYSFSNLEDMLECLFEIRESYKSTSFKPFKDDYLWVSYVLLALKVAQGQKERRRLQNLTEHFIGFLSGSPVLHTAVGLKWFTTHCFMDVDDRPYDLLVSFLLQCGADVHVKDGKKNTALHIVARFSQREEDCDLISRIARILLDAGTIVGVQNGEGQTPLDLAGPALVAELCELYPVSLKSLAATAVVKHQIPYVGEVPEDLAEFTKKH